MRKSFILLIFVFCLGVVLVSCKGKNDPAPESTDATESTQTTADTNVEMPTDEPTDPSQGATTEAPYVQNPEVNSSPYGDGDQGIGSDWSENY